MKTWLHVAPAGLLVLLLAACTSPDPAGGPPVTALLPSGPAGAPRAPGPELLRPPAREFTLGPGDRLDIEIAGEPASRTATLVGPDGKIYFQALPGIYVWGLTITQAREVLEGELARLYREIPRVTLTLRTVGSKQVWLLGRLAAPGLYPLTGPTTLLEAIARAGGPAPTPVFATMTLGGTATFAGGSDEAADLRNAFVMRGGQLLPVDFTRLLRKGDIGQNIYLEPDDLIYLPSAVSQEVYVLGAVAQPKAVSCTERTTLLAAIAGAGGTIKDAHLREVAVVRGGVGAPQITVLDYHAIVRGQAPDVQLAPDDIIYVPRTPYHTLTRYLDLILTTFARTIGVNAGARAVSRGEAIGISVPVGP